MSTTEFASAGGGNNETLTLSLPYFDGNLDRWNNDIEHLRNALHHPDGYDYNAQFPDIIGFLDERETEIIQGMGESHDYYSDSVSQYSLHAIRKLLPGLFDIIDSDIALVTAGHGSLTYVEFERRYTQVGMAPRSNGKLHLDELVWTQADLHRIRYLLSDVEPTVFYKGTARIKQRQGRPLKLDPDSLSKNKRKSQAQAPARAVVRTSGATIHSSPVFKVSRTRSWMRAASESR